MADESVASMMDPVASGVAEDPAPAPETGALPADDGCGLCVDSVEGGSEGVSGGFEWDWKYTVVAVLVVVVILLVCYYYFAPASWPYSKASGELDLFANPIDAPNPNPGLSRGL